MNLAGFSAKKLIAKRLGVPTESFVLLRLGGWLENIDSPAFRNGFANVENPVAYDSALPQTAMKFQATIAMKIGSSLGQEIFVDMERADIEAMVSAGDAGEFDLGV